MCLFGIGFGISQNVTFALMLAALLPAVRDRAVGKRLAGVHPVPGL